MFEAVDINDAPSRSKARARKTLDMDSESYDLDEFYVKGSDRRGHDKNVQTRITPDLHALVCKLVADPRTPYETPADVLRDGVSHRVKYLGDHLGDAAFQQAMADYVFHQGIVAARNQLADWQRTLEDTREALDEFQRAGYQEMLERQLAELQQFLIGKPESIADAAKSLIRKYL